MPGRFFPNRFLQASVCSPMRAVSRYAAAMVCLVAGLLLSGCNRPDEFSTDLIYHLSNGLTSEQTESIDQVLLEQFGTPNHPVLPTVEQLGDEQLGEDRFPEDLFSGWLSVSELSQAAGRVQSHKPGETQGLYQRHCARCHGVSGNGRGPTALYQSPYPRDFRQAVFKWKSTYRSAMPTAADLDRTIREGVPGTAMPSFRLVAEHERIILRQYVQYLALRGEFERELVAFVAEELSIGETLAEDDPYIDELLEELVDKWKEASSEVVAVEASSAMPLDRASDGTLERGKAIYHSERAGCAKCHGPDGDGKGVTQTDYALWARQRVELGREANANVSQAINADLPARVSVGRALKGTILRGGSHPDDLYRRIHQGIAGSPMPAVGPLQSGGAGVLTDGEIHDLAAYVLSLVDQASLIEPIEALEMEASKGGSE